MAAISCIVLGLPGTGKSSSYLKNDKLGITGLDPDKTIIINIAGKPMANPKSGFNAKKNVANVSADINTTTNDDAVLAALKRYADISKYPNVTAIVLEDVQQMMVKPFFMKGIEQAKGDEIFAKYREIGARMFRLLETINFLRDNLVVYLLWHSEPVYNGKVITRYTVKTVGQMLNKDFEPMGTTVFGLHTVMSIDKDGNPESYFYTQNYDIYEARSPYGLLPLKMKNDLGIIQKTIEENYFI